jgi:zinc transport system ATP-binding protein
MGYEGRPAVKDVSFELMAGDYLCIVGENGSGKSTLLKGILGLMKPWRGQIDLAGATVGYLPQQTAIQKDFPASVLEVVLSGCLRKRGLLPFYSKAEKDRAAMNMARLGIEPLSKQSFRALSGGQQRRVLLARALCAAENLLLLDEPMAGLDPVVTGELYDLIGQLNRERNMTIRMVSHDMSSALKYAGKILDMQTQAAFFGPTAEYLTTDICRRMVGGGSIA